MTIISAAARTLDTQLRERASRVIPGGMYGHVSTKWLPRNYPQFFSRAQGASLWDADDNEYVDLMCGYGPILLGYHDAEVDAAARAQQALVDTTNGPGPVMVELAELLVDTIAHADWAIFAKNGNDATTTACTYARAATGRKKILRAKGAYHGASPAFSTFPAGVTAEDQANFVNATWNDLASFEEAAAAHHNDVAAIILTPFQHDGHKDQELPTAEFAAGIRTLCDRIGAALILDEVRTGFRIDIRGSWETYGVRPDISAFSKAIANGYAISAVTGVEALRPAAQKAFVTGSFWFSGASMAAAVATITKVRDSDIIARSVTAGTLIRNGLAAQAAAHGISLSQSGPVQMPALIFGDDPDFTLADTFCAAALEAGTYLHPWHNLFVPGVLSDAEIDRVLASTAEGIEAVARTLSAR